MSDTRCWACNRAGYVWGPGHVKVTCTACGGTGHRATPEKDAGKCLHDFVEPPAGWGDSCWRPADDGEPGRCGWMRAEHVAPSEGGAGE